MACGGLGQRCQSGRAGAFLQPCAPGQAKPQAFRFNPDLGQKRHHMIGLGPAFGAETMIRYQGQHAAPARRHPIAREQGKRQAMRPARNRHGKPRHRAKRPKRRHGGGEFGATDRRGQRRRRAIPMWGLPTLRAAAAISRAIRLRPGQIGEIGAKIIQGLTSLAPGTEALEGIGKANHRLWRAGTLAVAAIGFVIGERSILEIPLTHKRIAQQQRRILGARTGAGADRFPRGGLGGREVALR